jgi:hypothetical protein
MFGYWAANREDPSKDRTPIAMGRCVRSECESNGNVTVYTNHGLYFTFIAEEWETIQRVFEAPPIRRGCRQRTRGMQGASIVDGRWRTVAIALRKIKAPFRKGVSKGDREKGSKSAEAQSGDCLRSADH